MFKVVKIKIFKNTIIKLKNIFENTFLKIQKF